MMLCAMDKLSFEKPFPDRCGWWEAASHEQEWHINQAAHYISQMETSPVQGGWALCHAPMAFLYHIPGVNILLYIITYLFYTIYDPDCMRHALERAELEQNREGAALLNRRIAKEDTAIPLTFIRQDYHDRIAQVLQQRFRNYPLLIGPPGVGKRTIARSYPGNLSYYFIDGWSQTEIERIRSDQGIAICTRMGEIENYLRDHFTPIPVKEADPATTMEILKAAFPGGDENHFNEAVRHARGPLPGEAVHLYDEAPDKGSIAVYASEKYGIPHFSEEKIKGLENYLKARIKGQDHAIQSFLPALKNFARGKGAHSGLHFPGLTGTGKTEMAYIIAEWLYGSRKKLFHVNMGDYQTSESLWTLLGTPSGLVGYTEGGTIIERAKEGPFLLLLDDIHHSTLECVTTLIHRLCEQKMLFDPLTRRDIDCSHVFVILTSNLGADAIIEAMKTRTEYMIFSKKGMDPSDYSTIKSLAIDAEHAFFKRRYESLNRLFTVPFAPIVDSEIIDHVTRKLIKKEKDFHDKTLTWTDAFIHWVTDTYGKDLAQGMRGIRKYVEGPLRNALTETEGDTLKLCSKGKIKVVEDQSEGD